MLYNNLINQTGTVSERYSYDAYGRRRNPANWTDYNVKAPRLINRGYTGHEMLDGFGLINMNGRMYDPVIGRILSPDPFVSSATSTQSYNRYSYCLNNPLRYTDPSGYNQHASDWGMDPVFYQPGFGPGVGGPSGPGSGNHWSDEFRSEYGNYMIGSANSFNNMYGEGAADIARGLASNPELLRQWRQEVINIEKVRENGGYWSQTTGRAGEESEFRDNNGNLVAINLPTLVVINTWNKVGSQGAGGVSGDYLLAKLYLHNQFGGLAEYNINASILDFSGTSQRELGLTGMKPKEWRNVNLFKSGINSNSLAFGNLKMTYQGNNQFSITSNRFDFDYQSNSSFGRNAGTFVGGAVFGQFYTIPISPFSILRDATGFGGSFMINFIGTVTIPK